MGISIPAGKEKNVIAQFRNSANDLDDNPNIYIYNCLNTDLDDNPNNYIYNFLNTYFDGKYLKAMCDTLLSRYKYFDIYSHPLTIDIAVYRIERW